MSKIRILSEHLSNRIAAGDVIERPASVVKELVENAIDAGAQKISIAVERAGTKLISVTDDGSGMDQDDALLSLEPHGTSKIHVEADIDAIATLGFRGEAIPSIASISRFRLTTRTADSPEGIRVEAAGGKILEVLPAGCAPGTTFEIRDLFFNTPARKKFLKSPPTEENHITECVIMLALPYPGISFDLTIDGRRALHSPAAEGLDSRLRAFFGRNFAEQMLPVEHRENGLVITGFTAGPGFSRTSRREQRTFVNGRAIESQAIYRGIRDGYATLAEGGRYSPCVLFISMDHSEVDVNVHPAKREVRFKQEYIVSRAVATAIGNALRHREVPPSTIPEAVRPALLMEGSEVRYTPQRAEQPELLTRIVPQEERILPQIPASPPPQLTDREPEIEPEAAPEVAPMPEPVTEPEFESIFPTPKRIVFNGDWPHEVIGVLDKSYILASGATGLILIDQHAAHERVLFEKLLRDSSTGVPAQHLLLPVTIELPQASAALLWRSRDLFEKLGFDVESLGNRTVMLNAIPASLPSGDLSAMLLDILDELVENADARLPLEKEFVARAACKAAIKSHDYLTLPAARSLLEQLANCRQGTLCPHGRPTMLTITMSEIARRFGRK